MTEPINNISDLSVDDARGVFQRIKDKRSAEVVNALVSGLSSPHWQIKREASELLVEFGPSVLKRLTQVIGDGTTTEAAWAMKVTARIKTVESLPFFMKLYGSEDATARAAVIEAVACIPGKDAEQFLLNCFNDSSWLNRVATAACFEKRGREVLKALQRGFLERSGDIKYWCLRLIVQICGHEATSFLRKGLISEDPSIRHYVIRSMEDVQDDWIHELLIEGLADTNWANRKAAATILQLRGEKAVPALISCLSTTNNPDVLYWLIKALSTIGDERALEPFESRLDSSTSQQVIEWIIGALGSFQSARAVSILIEAVFNFEDQIDNIRMKLKGCGPVAVPPLIEYCFSPNLSLQKVCRSILSDLPYPSVTRIISILDMSPGSVRRGIVDDISRLSPARLMEILSETINDAEHLKNLTGTGGARAAVSLSTLSFKLSKDEIGKIRAESAGSGGGTPVTAEEAAEENNLRAAKELAELLSKAVELGASDIHLKCELPPIFRIDGVLSQIDYPPFEAWQIKSFMIEVGGQRVLDRFEIDFETDIGYEIEGVSRFRVNFYSELDGAGIAFRVIPSRILSLADLGYPKVFKDICNKRQGLILVTGPTGSGKSTTIAAMIDYVNKTREDHIITIEDPVEFRHQNRKSIITYRELGTNTLSFGKALRGALRQDPDVILVGEMRDAETIRLAIVAAETGHLVFSTLHTSSAADSVDRILGEFPAEMHDQLTKSFSDALVAVVSQILVPGIGGGRVPVQEIMIKTYAVANLIREKKLNQLDQAIISGRESGMQSRDDHLVQLVREHRVAPDVAMTHAIDTNTLSKKLYKM